MNMRGRTATLESRVIYGPVAHLIGARVTATRPAPRPNRRSPGHRVEDHDITGTI